MNLKKSIQRFLPGKMLKKPLPIPKNFDIEVTNDCNTRCSICPRDKIAKIGYISLENFYRAVERFQETNAFDTISLCGLGEPLLHPKIVDFVKRLFDEGICPRVTTNGKLLTEKMSHQLLNAGMKKLNVSASGVGKLYEKIHRIKFDLVENNIRRFIEIADGKCQSTISLVRCDENKKELENIGNHFREIGVTSVMNLDVANRGGSIDIGRYFTRSNRFFDEAISLLKQHSVEPICTVPFMFGFLGWDGQYYLCCHDYSKKHPLGHVNEFGIDEILQAIKERAPHFSVCRQCDINPINIVREMLFKIEAGELIKKDLLKKLRSMKAGKL